MYDKVKCEVNKQLAFEGFSINEANQLLSVEKASKISDVQVKVDDLKSRLKAQGAHTLVFSYCKAELLANNYFLAVLESSKGLVKRIQDLAGVTYDGQNLMEKVFCDNDPILIINNFQSKSEKDEHRGFRNLLIGIVAMFRNHASHELKVEWNNNKVIIMNKSDIFWQTYLNLEQEVKEVAKYIFIADTVNVYRNGHEVTVNCESQLQTFSPHIADLLIRCCVQIEAISKELYYDNGGTKPRGDNTIFFDEDCLKLIDQKWATHNKKVMVVAPFFNLTKDENGILRPLKEAHKRSGIYWAKAYQAVKHDRIASIQYGNVKALLQAMAALYLLNLYYRKDKFLLKFKELNTHGYGLGSSIFSVMYPATDKLWYGNNPIVSESPYVVKYKDIDYQKIVDMQKYDKEALNKYWQQQPELKEPAFIQIIEAEKKKHEADPNHRILYVWELAKYRLKKQLPSTIPFDERKSRLLESEAWNCLVHQNNKHLSPDEITPDTIDKEIETAGTHWGIGIEHRYNTLKWVYFAMNDAMCEVYIP